MDATGTNWIITAVGSVNFLTLCVLIYKIGNFTGSLSTQMMYLQIEHKKLEERVNVVSQRTHDFASTAMVLNMMKDQVEKLAEVVDRLRDGDKD